MQLPSTTRGPWTISFEPGGSLWVNRAGAWLTVVRHVSGWQATYDEVERKAYVTTPDDWTVAAVEIPRGQGPVSDRLIALVTDWMSESAI